MQETTTIHCFVMNASRQAIACLASFLLFVLPVGAQNFCANEYQYFLENFGDGTDITSNPDVTSYNFLSTGTLNNQGQYRVSNSSYQKSDWHSSADHTGNINGKMMVANGQMGIFYNKIVALPMALATATIRSACLP